MMLFVLVIRLFFFFQAEDGIRDLTVTGVQTCALPICARSSGPRRPLAPDRATLLGPHLRHRFLAAARSEERRVGKSVDLGGRRIIKKKKYTYWRVVNAFYTDRITAENLAAVELLI